MSNVLPPWIHAQTRTLLKQRGHAWLLSGPSGLGQYSLGDVLWVAPVAGVRLLPLPEKSEPSAEKL